MKITLEHTKDEELEIIIKGDTTQDRVHSIVALLNTAGIKKTSRMIIGKKDDKEFVLPVKDIESIFTYNGSVFAKYNNSDYKIRLKLFEAEEYYLPYGFRRISKGILLNCKFIHYLEAEFSGNYIAVTKTKNKLTISRNYVSGVKQYIKEEL